MFNHCSAHFDATLSILEPTLVIPQGKTVARSLQTLLEPARSYTEHLYEANRHGNRTIVCAFSHPSAHGHLRWGDSINSTYLNNVVAPTLREAIRRT